MGQGGVGPPLDPPITITALYHITMFSARIPETMSNRKDINIGTLKMFIPFIFLIFHCAGLMIALSIHEQREFRIAS